MKTSKTYIAKSLRDGHIRAEKSGWDREVGDRLNIDNHPYEVSFLTEDYDTALGIIGEFNRRIQKNRANNRRIENKRIDNMLLGLVLDGCDKMGIDKRDAIQALNSLK